MKNSKYFLMAALCLAIFVIAGSAQKTFEKPYQKWSKEEAIKILTSSPWVQTYQSETGLAAADLEQIGRNQAEQSVRRQTRLGSSSRDIAPSPITIRLHSALPVRQALIRLQQLDAGYDKMDEKKRAEFDAATKNYLDCPLCQKYYIVTMTKFSNSGAQGVQEGLFQAMTIETFKGKVRLINDKNEKRELEGFTPPKGIGDFAVFFFPRKDEKGNDLITAQSKEFKFVFDGSFKSAGNPYAGLLPENFEFKISKLMMGEKLEF